MARHELTDEQWNMLSSLLNSNPDKRGRPSQTGDRVFINGVLFILAVGCPWRDFPSQYGHWKSVFNRFSEWSKRGLWGALFDAMREALVREEQGSLIDGSIVRAHQDSCGGKGGPAENMIGRSKGGPSTKIHAVTTLDGLPLFIKLSPGQEHDVKNVEDLIPQIRGAAFIADKGYDSNSLIEAIEKAGKEAVIASSKSRRKGFDLSSQVWRHIGVLLAPTLFCSGWISHL